MIQLTVRVGKKFCFEGNTIELKRIDSSYPRAPYKCEINFDVYRSIRELSLNLGGILRISHQDKGPLQGTPIDFRELEVGDIIYPWYRYDPVDSMITDIRNAFIIISKELVRDGGNLMWVMKGEKAACPYGLPMKSNNDYLREVKAFQQFKWKDRKVKVLLLGHIEVIGDEEFPDIFNILSEP